ncbi:hypothetical protein ABN034_33970 [Actinopolymorpha sp. B11F2]
MLTIEQVFALSSAMPRRFRAMVLLATFASLRWGEVAALQRQDLEIVVHPKPGGGPDDVVVERALVRIRRQ